MGKSVENITKAAKKREKNYIFYVDNKQKKSENTRLFLKGRKRKGEVKLAINDQVTCLEPNSPYPYNWRQTPNLTATGNTDYITVDYLEQYFKDPATGEDTDRVEEVIGIIVRQKNKLSIDVDVIKTDTLNKPLAGEVFKLIKGETLLKTGDYEAVKKGTAGTRESDRVVIDENGCFVIPEEGVTLKGLGIGSYTLTEVSPPHKVMLSR